MISEVPRRPVMQTDSVPFVALFAVYCCNADSTFVEGKSSKHVVDSSSSGMASSEVVPGGRGCVPADGRGRRMEDGQSWWDGCRRCFCHDGHEMCALIACPTLRCINPVLRKDSCCPSCPGTALPETVGTL